MQNRYLLFAFLSFFIVGTAIGQKKSKKKDKTLMEAPAAPKDPLAGVTKLSSVEGITEYSLTNGLNVLLYPDNSKQTITVNMTYKVGSRHEGYGETGMAHLLEHLVFKGTPNHPNIPNELSSQDQMVRLGMTEQTILKHSMQQKIILNGL